MILGSLHFWQNGFAVPHYSASLCGGIPIFADPQSSYYSLPQFLAFWWDPLYAIRVSILAFYAMGYFLTYLWLARALKYPSDVSHFGALLFVLNGFIFAHLFVGHLTHHSYLLCPALLYFLCKEMPGTWLKRLVDVCLFDLVWIYVLYSGGFHMLVLFAVLTLLVVPLAMRKRGIVNTLVWFGLLGGSLILSFALVCSGKLAATWRYSALFYQLPFNFSPDDPWTTTLRYFYSNPWDVVSTLYFGKLRFGIWEFVGFVSKVTLLGPIYWLLGSVARRNLKDFLFASFYSTLIVFLCFLAAGKGGNDHLLFFDKYHNPIKLLGVLIPLLIWATVASTAELAGQVRALHPNQWRALLFIGLSLGVCFEEWDHFTYFLSNHTGLDYQYNPKIYAELKQRGTLPPIQRVEAVPGGDSEAAHQGYSSLACYEPVFGYRWEGLLTQVQPGSVFSVRDGRFNLNHPGCLLYPEFFQCRPWDRVKTSDREPLMKFLSGDSAAWPVPGWQSTLITLNGLFLLFWLAFPLSVSFTWAWTSFRKKLSRPTRPLKLRSARTR